MHGSLQKLHNFTGIIYESMWHALVIFRRSKWIQLFISVPETGQTESHIWVRNIMTQYKEVGREEKEKFTFIHSFQLMNLRFIHQRGPFTPFTTCNQDPCSYGRGRCSRMPLDAHGGGGVEKCPAIHPAPTHRMVYNSRPGNPPTDSLPSSGHL